MQWLRPKLRRQHSRWSLVLMALMSQCKTDEASVCFVVDVADAELLRFAEFSATEGKSVLSLELLLNAAAEGQFAGHCC